MLSSYRHPGQQANMIEIGVALLETSVFILCRTSWRKGLQSVVPAKIIGLYAETVHPLDAFVGPIIGTSAGRYLLVYLSSLTIAVDACFSPLRSTSLQLTREAYLSDSRSRFSLSEEIIP